MKNNGGKNWSLVTQYHLFVDFKPAYDDRQHLYLSMEELRIRHKLIKMVNLMMEDTNSHVSIQSNWSITVTSKNGLWQRDILGYLLF